MSSNVRLRTPFFVSPQATTNPGAPPRAFRDGASAPQPGLTPPLVHPNAGDALPYRDCAETAALWWVGVHGGAGETTLATVTADTRAADHAWPIPVTPDTSHRVVLVARTHYAGLIAAQRAATHWATNPASNGIELLGLVLIADAPGRLPRPLRELAEVITGGVPRTWQLPWIPAWRLGPVSAAPSLPAEFRALFAELSLTAHHPLTHS